MEGVVHVCSPSPRVHTRPVATAYHTSGDGGKNGCASVHEPVDKQQVWLLHCDAPARAVQPQSGTLEFPLAPAWAGLRGPRLSAGCTWPTVGRLPTPHGEAASPEPACLEPRPRRVRSHGGAKKASLQSGGQQRAHTHDPGGWREGARGGREKKKARGPRGVKAEGEPQGPHYRRKREQAPAARAKTEAAAALAPQ
jgi:hypothetical protein